MAQIQMKTSIKNGFSIAMLNTQMVTINHYYWINIELTIELGVF
jgi:hypothetical protein